VIDCSLRDADEQYVEAKRRVGFVTLINHGVDPSLIVRAHEVTDRAFALSENVLMEKYFHGVREETKMRSGYFPLGSEKAKDHKGGWDVKRFWQIFRRGHTIPTYFPDEVHEFRDTMDDELYPALDALSFRLLGGLTRYSGVDTAIPYEDAAVGGDSMMRVIYYPAFDGEPPKDALRSTPHEDINFITLLVAASGAGLQIKTKEGEWIPVVNPRDSIIVNTGDMFQMASLGDFPSMTHRVVNEGTGNERRISIPFFVHPRPEVPLVTMGKWRTRCNERGVKSIPDKVMRELRDLGLKRHIRDDICSGEPLVTAGRYLQKRLSEIHPEG
jgi:isopenicillin N synthase-like dioxygenase